MSRSCLIDIFRRSFRLSQLSAQTQIPVDELDEMLRVGRSRRQILQAGILTAGALGTRNFLSANPPHAVNTATSDAANILVVGAGVAGLTVAYRLRQAGVEVDVIEASPRIGGRLRSMSKLMGSDDVVELGGEFIDTQHTAVRALVTELGLEMADLRQADAGLESEVLYFGGQRISHAQVIQGFSPLAAQITQDLLALGSFAGNRSITYHAVTPTARRLDQLSLDHYLDTASVDPVIKELVRVAYVTEYGRDADAQTCLNMLCLIGAEVGQWSTYGVSDERWHIVGGNEQLPQALAQRVERLVETDTRLESLQETGDRRYQASLCHDHTCLERTYDAVVLAVPFSVLRQVNLDVEMPEVKQRAIAQLGYGTCSKLAVPFKERIWRDRYGSTISLYTDLAFQNTWESARYRLGPSGWVTNLRGGREGLNLAAHSPDVQADAFTTNLNTVFPGMDQVSRGKALRAVWSSEPHALGSYSCYLPGQWTSFGGAEGESVGNLWFVGEHCSLDSQGYMNGAVETAEVAARGILRRLGQTALSPSIHPPRGTPAQAV